MLEEAEIVGQFRALLQLEQQAEQVYAQMLAQVQDAKMRQQIEQLHKDKLKHIRLTERLLEIVEG